MRKKCHAPKRVLKIVRVIENGEVKVGVVGGDYRTVTTHFLVT